MPKTQIIPIADLSVNTENYRFEPQGSQKEAIGKMIENQGDKLYTLSKHIIEHGINPNEKLWVTPFGHDSSKFYVLEGNRRLVALKLLTNPDIIDDPLRLTLKNKFKKLHDKHVLVIPTDIECIVYDTPTEAEPWIKLKHTGQNDGAGIVEWTSQQSNRFDERVGGKPSIALQTVKILEKEGSEELKARLKELKLTNLGRLIADPDVRDFFGLELNDGIIESRVSKKEVIKGLTQVAEDLLKPGFKVGDIYDKEDRLEYIKNFNPASRPNIKNKTGKPWRAAGVAQPTGQKRGPKRNPKDRHALIPKRCILNISNIKISNIRDEFQTLDVYDYTNAAAVLFRVFVELSLDCYIANQGLPKVNKKGRNLTLKEKICAVAENLITKDSSNKSMCKGIMSAAHDTNGILGVDTLHAYIHNPHFSPNPKDLIRAWDNIEEFMKKVWENA